APRQVDQAQIVLVGEARALPGRGGDDEPVGAVLEQMVHEAAGRLLVHPPARVERRDQRRVYAADRHRPGLSQHRATRRIGAYSIGLKGSGASLGPFSSGSSAAGGAGGGGGGGAAAAGGCPEGGGASPAGGPADAGSGCWRARSA